MSWVRLSRTRTGRPVSRRAERGDRGVAVRLHLLAAEAAAHPQALHGDLVVRQAQHVRDDLLGLGRVLRAGLDEDLPVLVDAGQRGVGLQVEVLLAGELELAVEDVRAAAPNAASGSPRRRVGRAPWKLSAAMASSTVTSDGSGSYSTSTAAAPSRAASRRLAEHPAHRVPVVHHLAREQRLVVLDPGVVDPGHVVGGEHAHHAGHGERGRGVAAT